MTTKPFGAFCSLDGHRAQGLCHISQLATHRVEETEDVAKVGDDVWVKVLSVEAGTGSRGGGRVSLSMKAVDQATGEEQDDGGGGGGGYRGGGYGGGGGGEALPELYTIHRGEIAKLESFGAFASCKASGSRGSSTSQISNARVESEDIPSILAVGDEAWLKVVSVDEGMGRIGLSMKLVSQGDGRDLDPSHTEAAADGERGKGGGGGRGRNREEEMEQRAQKAALMVPEYGGKQLGGGEKYELVSDGEDDRGGFGGGGGGGPTAASTSYGLRSLDGSALPAAAPAALSEAQQLQGARGEAARQGGRKKHKKEKKEKKSKKSKKEKHGKIKKHKKEKKKNKKRRARKNRSHLRQAAFTARRVRRGDARGKDLRTRRKLRVGLPLRPTQLLCRRNARRALSTHRVDRDANVTRRGNRRKGRRRRRARRESRRTNHPWHRLRVRLPDRGRRRVRAVRDVSRATALPPAALRGRVWCM